MLAVGRLMRRAIFQGNNTMDKLLIAKLPSEINSQNFKVCLSKFSIFFI